MPRCILVLSKDDEERYFIFDNHLDAITAAEAFKSHGFGWLLVAPEGEYRDGETPELPPVQKGMFE